ncbi:MAG: hypothetical protein IJQ81_18545, partial [Oscillibacter sp.]|nr:hypothetical protein [Oscillibacter sp.]
MIDKLQSVGQSVPVRAGQPSATSDVAAQAFGSMLQEQITRRDQIRQESVQAFPQTVAQGAIPQAVTQSDVAQMMRQAVAQTATQADMRRTVTQTDTQTDTRRTVTRTVAQTDTHTDTRRTVNFSKHALARAEERGIELTPDLMGKLADSVEKAQEKGAKNILAFSNSQAFIINIPYGRVITTMSGEEMREN